MFYTNMVLNPDGGYDRIKNDEFGSNGFSEFRTNSFDLGRILFELQPYQFVIPYFEGFQIRSVDLDKSDNV